MPGDKGPSGGGISDSGSSQVFVSAVGRVLEDSWEFAQPVHMCFVNLEKAFNRVPPGVLWVLLQGYRAPTSQLPCADRPSLGLKSSIRKFFPLSTLQKHVQISKLLFQLGLVQTMVI